MTVDPTCPSRVTKQGSRSAAGAVEAPTRARRRDRWELAAVGAPTSIVEDSSLATSRWCRYRDCRRRATPRHPCCCCWSRWSHYSCLSLSLSPCSYPCLCRCCWGWGQEGEGSSEDTVIPTVVGVEVATAMEGTLHLRVRSRTWRPVPGLPSGPAQSPRVRGHYGWCGRRGTVVTA
jgi:hypothetical protein